MKKPMILILFLTVFAACKKEANIEPFSLRQEILGQKFAGKLSFYSNSTLVESVVDNATLSINRGGIRDPYYFLVIENDGSTVFETLIEILENETFKLEYQNLGELYSGVGSYDSKSDILSFNISTTKGAKIIFEGKRK
jgi:hypothetical protein